MTKIEKIESQIKDLLSEVEKLKNYPKQKDTKIDGNLFTKEFWEAAKVISEHNKAKIMVGCSKQFNVSLETINKILNKL